MRVKWRVILAVALYAATAWAESDTFGLGTGRDGALTVTEPRTVINRYAQVTEPLAPGDTFLVVSSAEGFAAGDLVMVLQTTGIVPEPARGSSNPIELTDDPVGRWELVRVDSVGSRELKLAKPLLYSYAGSVTQLIRVPEYTDVEVRAGKSLVALPWDGSRGGVLAFLATGTVRNEGSIDVKGAGFRGSVGSAEVSDFVGCASLPLMIRPAGARGEGIATLSYGPLETGRENGSNGGGGGMCPMAGGGGGGNDTAGKKGGSSRPVWGESLEGGGLGGSRLILSMPDRLALGGGGGAGHGQGLGYSASAGAGGGVVFIRGARLAGTGFITADGEAGRTSSTGGGGGGGAGGSVYLRVMGTAECGGISARGGKGGGAVSTWGVEAGAGGAGGKGRVVYQASSTSKCSLVAQLDPQDPSMPMMDWLAVEAPPPPSITLPENNSSTGNKRPVISGTTAVGTSVEVTVKTVSGTVRSQRTAQTSNGAWTSTVGVDLSEGEYRAEAVAIKRQGNEEAESEVTTVTFFVDLTAPTTNFTKEHPTESSLPNVSFEFNANEAGATFECQRSEVSGTFPCSSPLSFTLISDGNHWLEVRAKDVVGNEEDPPKRREWILDRSAPDTSISSGPPPRTNSKSVSFVLESPEANVTYECRLNSTLEEDFETCQSPHPVTVENDGLYTLDVRARDRAGNADPSPATHEWTLDRSPPNTEITPTSGPQGTVNSTSATFSMTSNEAGTFKCKRDGENDFTVCPNPVTYTNVQDGDHWFEVVAVDEASNEDKTPARREWTVDTFAPQAQIGSRPPPLTNNTTAEFTFSVPNSTESFTFECSLDGAAFTACTSPQVYSGLAATDHIFAVRAVDSLSNVDKVGDSYSWTVDQTPPPSPEITKPDQGARLNTSPVAITGGAEANGQVEIFLDGAIVGLAQVLASGDWSFNLDVSTVPDGTHLLSARAKDVAGNVGALSGDRPFVLDIDLPSITITVFPPKVGNSTSVTFEFESDEAGSSYECSFDGAPFGPCPSPYELPMPNPGSYSLAVRAVDLAGNKSNPAAEYSWVIDRTPPPVAVLSPGSGMTVNMLRPVISGTSEPLATVKVYIDDIYVGDALVEPDGTWRRVSTQGFGNGRHEATAMAIDFAGNASARTPAVSFFIDTEPPETVILEGPPDPHNSRHASFTVMSPEGATEFDCAVDGAAFKDCQAESSCNEADPNDCTATFLVSLSRTGLEGQHSLEVRARDPGGNFDPTPAPYSWRVVITPPPPPEITEPGDGDLVSGIPTVRGTATHEGEIAVYLSNGGELQKIGGAPILNGTWEFTKELAEGDYTLVVDATDNADNTSSQVSVSFRVVPPKPRAEAIGGGLGCSSAGMQPWLALLGLLASSAWLSRRRR